MPRRVRATLTLSVGVVVLIVAVAVIGYAVSSALYRPARQTPLAGCTATALGGSFGLDLEQGRNAATIAAIGKQRGLPDHAVTVALATALQESKLINLAGGDRDSVGLFQQRPSQGWGPATSLHQPVYASNRFYVKLETIPGWRSLAVTKAAQEVQRSGAPDTYATWEPQARTMAAALTGETPAAFTCQFTDTGPAASTPLRQAMSTELGGPALGRPVSSQQGWTMASWLVAHADAYRLASVSVFGRTWTRTSANWGTDPHGARGIVTITRDPAS